MAKDRKSFDRNALEAAFSNIGSLLQSPIVVYLLGGGAMCFRNQKPGTKDLDLVFTSHKEFLAFSSALKKAGFVESEKLEFAYEAMHASGIWQNKEEFRFDLFVNTVCKALSLSESMAKRSKSLSIYGKLDVRIVSNEDVILFKGITERSDDANDMVAIIRSSAIDWDVVLQECKEQSNTARAWYGLLHDKFMELEKQGISPPITGQLLKLDNMSIVREAFEAQIHKGMNRKQAKAALLAMGFTKEEIEEAVGAN